MDTITRDQLWAKIDRGDRFQLVDALPAARYAEWHLPGAINLPSEFVHELAPRLLPDLDEEIIVYGAGPSSFASARAARMLQALGYSRVREYRGGKQEWQACGLLIDVPAMLFA